jgi:putative tryptophan/tyrosine transport system substrate-binding protein
VNAFEDGLRDLGYVPGRNVVIEYRFADGKLERLPQLAQDLVRLKVDVIVTGSNPHVVAAKQATTTIPIVMVYVRDPVGAGLVANVSRPGGNVTGLSQDVGAEISGKRLALLKELVPKLSRVAVLVNAGFPPALATLKAMEAPARTLGGDGRSLRRSWTGRSGGRVRRGDQSTIRRARRYRRSRAVQHANPDRSARAEAPAPVDQRHH